MKKLEKYYNKEYFLKAIYVVLTVLMILILGWAVYYVGAKLGGFFSFLSNVLAPLVLGLVFTYLLSPLVKKLEKKLAGSMKKPTTARAVAVIITFAIIIAGISLILGIIAFTVSNSLTAFNPAQIKEYFILSNIRQ